MHAYLTLHLYGNVVGLALTGICHFLLINHLVVIQCQIKPVCLVGWKVGEVMGIETPGNSLPLHKDDAPFSGKDVNLTKGLQSRNMLNHYIYSLLSKSAGEVATKYGMR